MSDKYPSDEAERFLVRMPPGMRDRIAKEASKAGRSMNAEIVLRLQQTLEPAAASEFARRFDRLSLQVDALHKWMNRQQEPGGIHVDEDEDQVTVGQVRSGQPATKAKRTR